MLREVPLRVRQQRRARVRVLRMEMDRIQLVVAHDCKGSLRLDHRPHDCNHCGIFGTAVDVVPRKDTFAIRIRVAQGPRVLL